MTQALTSDKNPLLKRVRRAVAEGTLTEDGYAVAEGFHLLEEALASKCEIQAVIVAETAIERLPELGDARVVLVSERLFAELASTGAPQGAIALVRPPACTIEDILPAGALAVVLDGVQDPGNAGAILRAAEAFGATGAIFLKGSVDAYNPKCLRGSAGSIFRLPVTTHVDAPALFAALDVRRIELYAASPRAAQAIDQADFRGGCAIAIGSEGHGISAPLAQRARGVKIPTAQVESLNAAVAAGIMLYEARRQRSALHGTSL